VHAVARLARFAVTDSVRQHNEKLRRIERLARTEKFTGEFRANKLRAAAGCSVHDENCISRFALSIFLRFSERPVMNPQPRQCFAGLKFAIPNGIIALGGRRIIGRELETGGQYGQEQCEDSDCWNHINDFAAVGLGFV
jgi:hypothetical protein